MRKVLRKGTKNRPRMKLGIPDLEHSKAVVLRSLRSPASRGGYQMPSMSLSDGTAPNRGCRLMRQ
jgi:hypothetical protein